MEKWGKRAKFTGKGTRSGGTATVRALDFIVNRVKYNIFSAQKARSVETFFGEKTVKIGIIGKIVKIVWKVLVSLGGMEKKSW
ncbi:MAG: hypothetical protein IJE97_00680 [Thermoguttaceae bacterium]|nr:hypothetical protein [Thermoguttaceae bacterium]MBQ6828017.1 hypothetical protein [Thermoguttaceae bacterium]